MKATLFAVVFLSVFLIAPAISSAHCDTLSGPVIMDARAALEKGDVTPVLKWVGKEDEPAIKEAFSKAAADRAKGPDAREKADNQFFETLVRIHREGEGEPYTGIKPEGAVEPGIAAADEAIDKGSADAVVSEITGAAADGIKKRLSRVMETKKHKDDSVDAGRAYVAAYVEFIHYVEKLHEAAEGGAGHGKEHSLKELEHIH